MQSRFVSTFVLLTSATVVVFAGCGGDDETSKSTPSGGMGGSASGSGGKGGTNGGGGDPSTGGDPATNVGGEPGVGGGMGSPEPTGSRCEAAADCYAGLDTSELSGPAECIDKVEDGYCTHECEEDADCCAVDGECRTGFKQVCAPFENTGKKYCFLSCEDEDLVAAGGAGGGGGASAVDANEYCEREAHPRFGCRSTGGGDENRKVCLPDAGAAG
ncbi:MAG TPA: hypothetical protein VM686_22580, partial [Polyangiaceae bacterium]|nr:hypothetical protein [Polyangiaceae bacterium]